MKKFISMVMAAAMVVTMLPATAFAANAANFKVVDAYEITAEEAKTAGNLAVSGAELQLVLTDVDTKQKTQDDYEITLTFSGAEFDEDFAPANWVGVFRGEDGDTIQIADSAWVTKKGLDGDTKVTFKVKESATRDFKAGDTLIVKLDALAMTKDKVGHTATVKVGGSFGTSEALTFAAIVDNGIKVSLEDDVVKVAPEEVAATETIVIEPTAGTNFADIATGSKNLTLKVSKGFEFVYDREEEATLAFVGTNLGDYSIVSSHYVDDNEIEILLNTTEQAATALEITGLKVEATTADADDVATVTVKFSNLPSQKVEVAKVVDMAVIMELVDADEDVPVFYSGVNVANDGLTVDDDHKALEVKIYETFVGSWSNHKDFTLSLPEGVYVAAVEEGVEAVDTDNVFAGGNDELEALFVDAYNRGDHKSFEFKKRTFNETHDDDNATVADIRFTLTLVADPGFVGDVTLKLEGAALETQEVTIAKFVAPMTVKAEQNDVIIDYRYTEVPTAITVTEAEAGLWAEGLDVWFSVERADMIQFEDEATFTVNEESEMEVSDYTNPVVEINGVDTRLDGVIGFVVDEESDEEAAVVTISDLELFMQRNIPAGPYDLTMAYAPGTGSVYDMQEVLGQSSCNHSDCTNDNVGNINDYSDVVHEAWINVVTAGRDQDDASFTTEVVVPVGESYIVAGETQIALDVPAYINADGYTMLPVRAVATALGINNEAVQWDQATKTVIIMYGQRIITMTAGSSVVYVSGTAIPAKSAVEIVDGRAFLGLRDLATTLGVAKIAWDPATNVATLNPKA